MFRPSFRGGIHPPENKYTETTQVEQLSVPHECRVPLQQHIGKEAVPVVEVGSYVTDGQLIAKADGFVSANVHAPVPGKITAIAEFPTHVSPTGRCIVIETFGTFSQVQRDVAFDWRNTEPKLLLSRISDAGVVGMGGAAFPTHVKLSPPETKIIDYLLINAAECEPYLTVDDHLTQRYPDEIVEGIEITMKILGVDKAVIGVEENKKSAYAAVSKSAKSSSANIRTVMIKTKYPQGAEKQLIETLCRRQVPRGGLPMDAGVVVQNVGTIYAIQQAVCFAKPLTDRLITVSGSLINKPGDYRIKIGTRISDIVAECGGLKGNPAKIIMGGPMCGLALSTMDIPVVKGTSGILFLSEKECSVKEYLPCIRCGKCVSACPVNLLPHEMSVAAEHGLMEIAARGESLDCIQCGACSFVCPQKRPISHFVKVVQQYTRKQMMKKC